MKASPKLITSLSKNEIFVFGSNKEGYHIGGAAKIAHESFGAEWGIGIGHTGKCYAIPTMSGIEEIEKSVSEFIEYAKNNQYLIFLVTEIGCGIAGYTPQQIAPLFKNISENVLLPKIFTNILTQKL